MGRRDGRARALGAFAAAFGTFFVAVNLWVSDDAFPLGPLVACAIAYAAWLGAGGSLLVAEARALSGRRRMAAVAVLAAATAWTVSSLSWASLQIRQGIPFAPIDIPSPDLEFWAYAVPLTASYGAAVTLVGIVALGRPATPWRPRFAFAFGAYFAFFIGNNWSNAADLPFVAPWVATSLGALAVAAAAACWLAWPDAREGRRVAWGLLAVVLAGLVAYRTARALGIDTSTDLGFPGLVRTVGAVALALAIFRHDLLGVPLPRLAERRGAVAAGAVGLLFVVAQVAQNVFSAQYGLVMGGVVAGAFLFAAHPLQRAFEGRFGGRIVHDVQHAPSAAAKDEDAYRKALRLALRDRRLTREEETHLHELAERLGISGSRAHALLAEVEREKEVR